MTKKQILKAIKKTLYTHRENTILCKDCEFVVEANYDDRYDDKCELLLRTNEYIVVAKTTHFWDYDLAEDSAETLYEGLKDFFGPTSPKEVRSTKEKCEAIIKQHLLDNIDIDEEGKLILDGWLDEREFPDEDIDRPYRKYIWSFADYGWDFSTAFSAMVLGAMQDFGFDYDEEEVHLGCCPGEIDYYVEDLASRPEILRSLGITDVEALIEQKKRKNEGEKTRRTGIEPTSSNFGEDYV